MDYYFESLEKHREAKGKISIESKFPLETKYDLSIGYTPGVAAPCQKIAENIENVYQYTSKGNLVAVVTNGTAVLGLGDVGPEASLPVMEGKAILFKKYGNIDAIPICINSKDSNEIVSVVEKISPTFGGINLEDIKSPQCFEIEEKLKERLHIPVFHDDQHGTAIVVCAGLINACRLLKKDIRALKVVLCGPGAAGTAIAKMLINLKISDLIICGRDGIIGTNSMRPHIKELAAATNPRRIEGGLTDALEGADVFIGVSTAGILTAEMVKRMNLRPIIFALANPVPEIDPETAKAAGAGIIGTGRSDYPNQINNVLVFPGIFRGALDARAAQITEEMKVSAAYALANMISDEELTEDYIIPSVFDKRVCSTIAKAVFDTWKTNT